MVPATGIAVAGAKLRITDAGILPAMRSAEAIVKDTPVTGIAHMAGATSANTSTKLASACMLLDGMPTQRTIEFGVMSLVSTPLIPTRRPSPPTASGGR